MNVEKLQWSRAPANAASHTPGWRRGTCVARLTEDGDTEWVAVVFKDEEGYWFRAGTSRMPAKGSLPVFHGPFDTEDEAKIAALMVLRMGGEL